MVITQGGSIGFESPDSWSDNVGFSSTTYKQRQENIFKARVKAITEGTGISPSRIKLKLGDLNKSDVKYEAKPNK